MKTRSPKRRREKRPSSFYDWLGLGWEEESIWRKEPGQTGIAAAVAAVAQAKSDQQQVDNNNNPLPSTERSYE